MGELPRKTSAKGKGRSGGNTGTPAKTRPPQAPEAGEPTAAQADHCLASLGEGLPPETVANGAPAIVGIGASAGGLEALRTFVANLPTRSRFAYVIAQHLSPTHQSMLVPLLSRETQLPVHDVKDGMAPEANVIYITPAGSNIRISQAASGWRRRLRRGCPNPPSTVSSSRWPRIRARARSPSCCREPGRTARAACAQCVP